MKRKVLLGAAIIFIALIWIAGSIQVSAQGPINTHPGAATYIDLQWHVIPPTSELWYLFDYSGDRSIMELVLVDGFKNRLQFNVYTPDQVRPPDQFTNPIGRGSSPQVNCEDGKCPSPHLLWKGSFTGGGTFFVQLINPNPEPRVFFLGIAGSGVTLRVPTPAAPPPQPSPTPNVLQTAIAAAVATLRAPITPTLTVTATAGVTPAATTTPTATLTETLTSTSAVTPTATVAPPTPTSGPQNTYPTSAIYVFDSTPRTIPENAELWFAFDYAGDRTKIVIVIPGGNENRLAFRLYTPDQIERYEQTGDFIGEGTAPMVPCDSGKCASNDLLWSGDFNSGGTYFVQVINRNSVPKTFQLIVVGSGVVLGR
jgi:hypothetical protein